MEKDFFLNKIWCEFVILTQEVNNQVVTDGLNIKPNRCYNKGDKFISNHTNVTLSRPHGLWAIKSEIVISKEQNLTVHFKYFEKILGNKIDELDALKSKYGFEFVIYISIQTEDAGAGFDLLNPEISFIIKLIDRITCFFVSKDSID
jgi:hypothetical protein